MRSTILMLGTLRNTRDLKYDTVFCILCNLSFLVIGNSDHHSRQFRRAKRLRTTGAFQELQGIYSLNANMNSNGCSTGTLKFSLGTFVWNKSQTIVKAAFTLYISVTAIYKAAIVSPTVWPRLIWHPGHSWIRRN